MKTTRKHGPDSRISLLQIATKLPLNTDFTSKEFGIFTEYSERSSPSKTRRLVDYRFLTRNKKKNRFVTYRMNKKQQDAMIKKHNETHSKNAIIQATRIKKKVSAKEMLVLIAEAHTMYCEHVLRKAKLI